MEEIIKIKEENLIRAYSSQAHWRINKVLCMKYGFRYALWISDILSKWDYFRKSKKLDNKGFFFNTQEEIQIDTGISPNEQRLIINRLREEDILRVEKRGLPARNWYKFNMEKLFTIMGSDPLTQGDKFPSSKGTRNSETRELYKENNNKEEIRIKEIRSSKEDQRVSVKPSRPSSSDPPLRESLLKRRTKAQIIRSKSQSFKIPKSKPVESKSYPKPVLEIMSLWLSLGLVQHQSGKKAYDKAMQDLHSIMRGKFFDDVDVRKAGKRFSSEQLWVAINNFALAALNPDYDPGSGSYKEHLKHCGLSEFLYNPYGKKYKSLFLHYLNSRPEVLAITTAPLSDNNPGTTKILRNFYINDVLGGIRPKEGFSQGDENKFIKGAQRALEFLDSNLSKIRGTMRDKFKRFPAQFARVLCDALWERYGEDGIKEYGPGVFHSDNTFNKVLPAYLHSQAIIETGEGGAFYHGGRKRE